MVRSRNFQHGVQHWEVRLAEPGPVASWLQREDLFSDLPLRQRSTKHDDPVAERYIRALVHGDKPWLANCILGTKSMVANISSATKFGNLKGVVYPHLASPASGSA